MAGICSDSPVSSNHANKRRPSHSLNHGAWALGGSVIGQRSIAEHRGACATTDREAWERVQEGRQRLGAVAV